MPRFGIGYRGDGYNQRCQDCNAQARWRYPRDGWRYACSRHMDTGEESDVTIVPEHVVQMNEDKLDLLASILKRHGMR